MTPLAIPGSFAAVSEETHRIGVTIKTARLSGRPICMDDVGNIQALHHKPPVAAHIGGDWTDDRSHQFVQGAAEHWERYGYGQWVFTHAETGAFAGRSGLRHYYMDGRDEIELLYAFEPDLWGQGLSTEAACAIVDWGFRGHLMDSIVSFTLPDNPGSRRVMEKAGLEFEKEMLRLEPPEFLVYRITRNMWEALSAS